MWEDEFHAVISEARYVGDKAELLYVTRLVTIDKATKKPVNTIQVRELLIKKGLDKVMVFPRLKVYDGKIVLSGANYAPMIFSYITGELLDILKEVGTPIYWDDGYLITRSLVEGEALSNTILFIYDGESFNKKAEIVYSEKSMERPQIKTDEGFKICLTENYSLISV